MTGGCDLIMRDPRHRITTGAPGSNIGAQPGADDPWTPSRGSQLSALRRDALASPDGLNSPEDAASIARVHVESWRTTYRGLVPDAYLAALNVEERTHRWREILNLAGQTTVAEVEGAVVGFISGGPIHELVDGYDAEVYAIYLLQEFQGKGIGRALLLDLARRLDEVGFRSLAVWVIEKNPATRFYERSGAIRVGAREREIGGARLPLVAYGWPDLRRWIASSAAAQGHGEAG